MNIFKIPNNLHQQFMISNVNRKYHTLMKQLEIYTQNLPRGFEKKTHRLDIKYIYCLGGIDPATAKPKPHTQVKSQRLFNIS